MANSQRLADPVGQMLEKVCMLSTIRLAFVEEKATWSMMDSPTGNGEIKFYLQTRSKYMYFIYMHECAVGLCGSVFSPPLLFLSSAPLARILHFD